MSTGDNTEHQKLAQAVANFSKYCDELESVVSEHLVGVNSKHSRASIRGILNGEAASALQRLVPVDVRRQAGLFFTSNDIASKVAKHLAPLLQTGTEVCDPACGAGNLLIACSEYLPCGETCDDTAKIWSRLIKGYDIYPEFIRAARLRLAVTAANKHSNEKVSLEKIKASNLFQGLKTSDIFSQIDSFPSGCIVVNPPFGYMPAPAECDWGSGKIQIAGWFMEKLLKMAHEGQHFVAVLPDVLRSGTRYKRWRNTIAHLVSSIIIEPAGRFDPDTDVDVFIVHFIVGKGNNAAMWHDNLTPTDGSRRKVSDYFEIQVGPVVPHRDPLEGAMYPYIHARTAIAWQILENISESRKSTRKVYTPPFVVVHRTSSPSDRHRCVGSIVNVSQEVAVENHLIVLSPKDGSLESCRRLISSLRSSATDEWLNYRIRCRHLTVDALRNLPYYE